MPGKKGPRRHISADLAIGFLKNALSNEDTRWVLRHLLGKCQRCVDLMKQAAIEAGIFPSLEKRPDYDYSAIQDLLVFPRAEAFDRALGRIIGLAQYSFLMKLHPVYRLGEIQTNRAYQHLGLYDRLIEAADTVSKRDTSAIIEHAELAIEVAKRMRLRQPFKQDLQAGAHGIIGNAWRVAGDIQQARGAFLEAAQHIENGTGDPMVAARLRQYESALYIDLGEFEKAELLLREAYTAYRHVADTHRQGRTLLKMGTAAVHHDPRRAVGLLKKAEKLFDVLEEPMLEICLRHNLAWCFNEIGLPKDALAILDSSRHLYRRFDRAVTLRMHWLEARIASSFQRSEDAEEILRSLWEEMNDSRQNPLELALVSIDLVQAMAVNGKIQECIAIVNFLVPILEHLGLHKDGLAVWLMLQEELRKGVVERSLWKRMEDYFRRHWRVPAPFEEPVH
jgi:tetratricopeptide (TPR) repeat protein